jgi:arylsulfatase A-like enzyme
MKIIQLVVDSLRADIPGYAGGPARTPTLDRIAEEGTRFTQAFCSGSWTIPSLSSMDTGAFPHRVGVCNWGHSLPQGRTSLLALLDAAGWQTHVYTPNPDWAFWGWPNCSYTGNSQDEEAMTAALQEPGDAFYLIHHWHTHLPYLTVRRHWGGLKNASLAAIAALQRHPDAMTPKLQRLYHRSVEHLSEERLPRLLEAATKGGEDVLLMITADHGEQWGECMPPGRKIRHIYDLHGRWLEDATTRVPLIFWGTSSSGGIPAKQALEGFARGVDVGPTLAEAAGLAWPENPLHPIQGHSLLPAILGGQPAPASAALTVRSHNTHVPDTYPPDGKEMWRGYSLRTSGGRWTWDAVYQRVDCSDGAQPSDEILETLQGEWALARDAIPVPAPPPHRRGEPGLFAERMRRLGYWEP